MSSWPAASSAWLAATSTAGCSARTRSAAADLANALDGDSPAFQAGTSPDMLGRCPHALEDAEGRQDGGIAGPAVGDRPAGHVRALAGDNVHVLAEGADIAGGDIAPVQGLDEPAIGAQECLGLEPRRIPDDDGLAATQVETG